MDEEPVAIMSALGSSLWIALLAALAGPAAGAGLALFIFSTEPVPSEPVIRMLLLTASPASVSEVHTFDAALRTPAR